MTNPQSGDAPAEDRTGPGAAAALMVNGARLVPDLSGALFWPDQETLVVSDLHFEKASSFAARGHLLPPYDTADTLRQLEAAAARFRPARVICLGDSFHDGGAAERLGGAEAQRLRELTRRHEWIWIRGNHDPEPPADWGGYSVTELSLGALMFRHEALNGTAAGEVMGEVSGHFHPKASVRIRARRLTARCFVTDGRRLIVPAFGAFTGGLDVRSPAISRHFQAGFTVHMLGRQRVFPFPASALADGAEV